jgi:hypothetical protein
MVTGGGSGAFLGHLCQSAPKVGPSLKIEG